MNGQSNFQREKALHLLQSNPDVQSVLDGTDVQLMATWGENVILRKQTWGATDRIFYLAAAVAFTRTSGYAKFACRGCIFEINLNRIPIVTCVSEDNIMPNRDRNVDVVPILERFNKQFVLFMNEI